jgi:hypothetical protein
VTRVIDMAGKNTSRNIPGRRTPRLSTNKTSVSADATTKTLPGLRANSRRFSWRFTEAGSSCDSRRRPHRRILRSSGINFLVLFGFQELRLPTAHPRLY